MPANTPYPSLGDDGWIFETGKKLDAIMADFYMAEWSSNLIFYGLITSLPQILQSTNGDVNATVPLARSMLTTQLGRYFDTVNVEVSEYDSEEHIKQGLYLSIEVADRNEELTTLHNLVTTQGTMIADVQKLMSGAA